MSEKKRHHYVPQFLLRRFAEGVGDDAKLELIPRDDLRRVIPLSVEKSLAENYFYAIETPQGRDNFVEDLLVDHVEDPAATAMRRVLDDGRPLSAPAWRAPLALFLAFQRSRGPAMRQMLADHLKATARKMLSISTPAMVMDVLNRKREAVEDERIAADLGLDGDEETTEAAMAETTEAEAEEIIAFAREGNYQLAVQRVANLHADSLLRAAIEMVPYFDERVWCVLEFETRSSSRATSPSRWWGTTRAHPETPAASRGPAPSSSRPIPTAPSCCSLPGSRPSRGPPSSSLSSLVGRRLRSRPASRWYAGQRAAYSSTEMSVKQPPRSNPGRWSRCGHARRRALIGCGGRAAKISSVTTLCEEEDSNLHSFRNRNLNPYRA